MISAVIIRPTLALFLLFLPNLFPFATAQGPVTTGRVAYNCIESRTYTGNDSAYRTNLKALLATLPAKMDPSGFHSASSGPTPDRVNTAALCRGDVDLDTCRECVRAAAVSILSSCPNQKQAVTWYRLCMLRYSDQPISGALSIEPGVCLWNPFASSSEPQFWGALKRLVDKIRGEAVNGGHTKKVAVGKIAGPDFQTVFALAECTPELDPRDCNKCLLNATGEITECCNLRRGCRIHKPSCNLRYEIFHFFNETRLEESQYVPLLPEGNKGHNRVQIFTIVGVSFTAGVVAAVFIGILCRMKRKQNSWRKIKGVDNIRTAEPLEYGFKTIKAATSDFSDDNKLGEGGFGVVFKGTLPNGLEIAVKRLPKDSGQGSNSEFKNEARFLARLLHRNLVRLLGFCEEGKEKLLVYEFVPNGSLEHYIFDPNNRCVLDWDKRFKIIWGIAQGLLYLHEDSQLKIIHSDLKASNVLLDKDMVPKIADFSLTRLLEQDETREKSSMIVETHGFKTPEHAMHEKISIKTDVFSFGVLALEIISGRKSNYTSGRKETAHDLLNFVWKSWCDGRGINIVDDNFLRSASDSMSDILKCIHIGLLCVQQDAASRPTMASVVQMLGSLSTTMATPSEPALCIPSGSGPKVSLVQDNNSSMVHTSSI